MHWAQVGGDGASDPGDGRVAIIAAMSDWDIYLGRPKRSALLGPKALKGAGSILLTLPSDPRNALKTLRDFSVVRTSALFDDAWYLGQSPEGISAGIDPALHYVRAGATQGIDPGPAFSTRAYLIANPDVAAMGTNPLVHYVRSGNKERRRGAASIVAGFPLSSPPRQPRFAEPTLRTFTAPTAPRRVTLVADRVAADSSAEGVMAGIVLAALLADRMGASLRIVTLMEPPAQRVVTVALESQGVRPQRTIEYEFTPLQDPDARLATGEDEVFVTTSWYTAGAVRRTRPTGRLIYLVAEDERLLYPAGEQTLRITEVLSDPAIELVVRTQALYEHLLGSGIADLHRHAQVFEPAFPPAGREVVSGASDRRRLACFASPDVPGDLYHRAVDAIDTALRTGVVDPAGWSIALVGDGLGPVTFAHDVTAELIESPYWQARDAIAQDVDVGLVLGSSPSPRDWGFRLAAHGRVVVTNRFALVVDEHRHVAAARFPDVEVCLDRCPHLIRCRKGQHAL